MALLASSFSLCGLGTAFFCDQCKLKENCIATLPAISNAVLDLG
jgi:hypothetical protein